jgi:cytochrome c7-like protein
MSDRHDRAHLYRVAALFALGLVLFFIARAFLLPKDFGLYGHYRAGALADAAARPISYAGQAACVECHSDVGDLRKTNSHARVACETCHGPLAKHASGDDTTKPVRPDGRTVCMRCHLKSASKPAKFPQIVLKDHADDGPCVACHQSHAPKL